MAAETELYDLIRAEHRRIDLREVLSLSTRALLGVTEPAASTMDRLDIKTVFDLATSPLFAAAASLTAAARNPASPLYQYGVVTSEVLRGEGETTRLDEVPDLPVDVLQALPMSEADSVKSTLDVQRVRELACYPPYRAAVTIVDGVFFPENRVADDPERPADLTPRTGEYPTERVQYTTLLLDEIKTGRSDHLSDLLAADFQPIDLDRLAKADKGFSRVAFGALLTYNQSWYSQGVTLGQLLHSTALAPGESTRVAVIDWSRRSRAGQTETISETEELTQDTSHNRAISEVTSAVADEAQEGFSKSKTRSAAEQHAVSTAGEMSGGLVGAIAGGPSVSGGTSDSSSVTAAKSQSYSSSWGHREVGSSMAQNIADSTHQQAHASRSRRASVVKEVAQSEHEQVSTRVLTNYNHMHALTVQYYEVVQVYRVEVALARADRVIFIPIDLADFDDESLVRRFRAVLARVALTPQIRDGLERLDVIELVPDRESPFTRLRVPIDIGPMTGLTTGAAATGLAAMADKAASSEQVEITGAAASAMHAAVAEPAVGSGARQRSRRMTVSGSLLAGRLDLATAAAIRHELWSTEVTSKLATMLDVMVLRPGSLSMYLPNDVAVDEIAAPGVEGIKPALYLTNGQRVEAIETSIALSQVQRITVAGSSPEHDVDVDVVLTLNRNGVRFPVELPGVTVPAGARETKLVRVATGGIDVNLRQHLNDNRAHYSQAIYRSLDPTQIAWLLSGYGITMGNQTVPISQVVDPRPIRYIGNYLAFKMNSDAKNDTAWKEWLDHKGIHLGSSKVDIVPLGTGGVFAEAVLGRSNSAEKLDITRFWNWQDSPIPIQPTEIAAIQTGSRAVEEDITPGQLSNPVVSITNPTALPDPVGTAAVLAAIQNGTMFRDMSGLQGTIGLTQSALQAAAAGAASAAQQAGTNMQNHLQAQTERMRIAADMVKSLASSFMGGGSTGSLPAGNHSQDGAKINYFDKMQGGAAIGAGPSSGGGGSGEIVSPNGSGAPGGDPIGNGGGGGSQGPRSAGVANPAFAQALWGDDRPPSQALQSALELPLGYVSDTGPADDAMPLAGSSGSVWPKLDADAVKARLNELEFEPYLFQQGGTVLCPLALFWYHMFIRNGDRSAQCGRSLLATGTGKLGGFTITTDEVLRSLDWKKYYAKFVAQGYPNVPEADWMLMASVQDSANIWWWQHYTGTIEDKDSNTPFTTLAGYYEKTGWYKSVTRREPGGTTAEKIAHLQSLRPREGKTQVALWMNAGFRDPIKNKATHMISLEEDVAVTNDKILVTFWTYGKVPEPKVELDLPTFLACFLGSFTAEF